MPGTILSVRALVLAGLLICATAGEPKGVGVSLRVKWPGTSSLLEAAEYLVDAVASTHLLVELQRVCMRVLADT